MGCSSPTAQDIWEWSRENDEGAERISSADFDAFRTQVGEQLERIEQTQTKHMAQVPNPPKVDAASVASAAPIAPHMDEARLGQVLRGVLEEVIEAKMVKPTKGATLPVSPEGSGPVVSPQFDEARVAQALRSAVEDVQNAKHNPAPLSLDDATTGSNLEKQVEGFKTTYCIRGPMSTETGSGREEAFIPATSKSTSEPSEQLIRALHHSRFMHQLQRLFDHFWSDGNFGYDCEMALESYGAGPLSRFNDNDRYHLMRCLNRADLLLTTARFNGQYWSGDPVCSKDPDQVYNGDDHTLARRVNEVMINQIILLESHLRCDGGSPLWGILAELEKTFDALDLVELRASSHGIPRPLGFEERIVDGRSLGMIIRYDARFTRATRLEA